MPDVPVKVIEAGVISNVSSAGLFAKGHVVFFTVPGAFTPTCSDNHLPGFIANAAKFRAAGIERIVCGATNDHHVMKAWAGALDPAGTVDFLADGNGLLAKALGLDKDMTERGMATRYARAAMLVRDGVLEAIFMEDDTRTVSVSGAPAILMVLEAERV